MSLMNVLSQLNSPAIVLSTGAAVLAGLPLGAAFCTTSGASLASLQAANVGAFALNCAAVSVPGRIDGQAQNDLELRKKKNDDHEEDRIYETVYSPQKGRSLIAPAGWAFAIWGPIYVGEALFCASLFFAGIDLTVLSNTTAPFVAANLMQSLWCASFRPSYMTSTWPKFVSVAMLGGTAYSLSQVHAAASDSLYYLPLTLHFGWTTAATLVNLNGSLAMSNVSDRLVIAVGHASTVLATALGVGATWVLASPAYGLTIAWALAACGDGMTERRARTMLSAELQRGMRIQQYLCAAGSALCVVAAAASYLK